MNVPANAQFSTPRREVHRIFGAVFVVSLAILGCSAFADEAPQDLDCSRVYLGDLSGDLQRAETESEEADSEAKEAGAEAENAEARANEMEALADEEESRARKAQAAAEAAEKAADECEAAGGGIDCAELGMDASAAETTAFIAEQDAQFATRDAERARRGASAAAERAASTDQRAKELREQVERLRATKRRMEACAERDAEAAAEPVQRQEPTAPGGATTGQFPSRWRALDELDLDGVSIALRACNEVDADKAAATFFLLFGTFLAAYDLEDQTEVAVATERAFAAVEQAREKAPEAFDIALLRMVRFERRPLEEIRRTLGRLDRRADVDYEIRRGAMETWGEISRRALADPLDMALVGVHTIRRLMIEEGHPDGLDVGLELLRSLAESGARKPSFSQVEDPLAMDHVCEGLPEHIAARK